MKYVVNLKSSASLCYLAVSETISVLDEVPQTPKNVNHCVADLNISFVSFMVIDIG